MSGSIDDPIVSHVYGLDRQWDINPDRMPAVLRTKRQPMRQPATAQWDLDISAADFAELKLGFRARQMEDKWAIAAAEPDGDGVTSVYIYAELDRVGIIESITWEQNLSESATVRHREKRAKMMAAYLCRTHVGCVLDKLPTYDFATIWGSDGDDEVEEGKETQSRDVKAASS